jgi:hypothetical protein
MINKIATAVVFLIFLPVLAWASGAANTVEVKGQSYSVAKPDIAYFFLKIDGKGEDFEVSTQQAKNKIEELKKSLAEIMGSSIEINILKKEIKPKASLSEDSIMEMQQEAMKSLAKAMKGEENAPPAKEKKKEMITTMMVYFTSANFSDDSILRLKSKLADKEIAFDKNGLFDFPSSIDMNNSTVVFGLKEPNRLLAALASEAYVNARRNAEIIARASNKALGGTVSIGGCGCDLEGTVTISDKGNLLGKDLGPLSVDPSRLVVKYEKKYEFALK